MVVDFACPLHLVASLRDGGVVYYEAMRGLRLGHVVLDYETFETQRHARHHLPPADLRVRPEQVEAVFASFGIASSIEALPVGL